MRYYDHMHRTLFVCTGNICRSPTANGVFRHAIRLAGLQDRFWSDGAGIQGCHLGEAPDPRTVAEARSRGVELSDLRARVVRPSDFLDYDLILAMDQHHLAHLRRMAPPEAASRVQLFLDPVLPCGTAEVPDPYYGDAAGFTRVFDLVEQGVQALVGRLVGQGV